MEIKNLFSSVTCIGLHGLQWREGCKLRSLSWHACSVVTDTWMMLAAKGAFTYMSATKCAFTDMSFDNAEATPFATQLNSCWMSSLPKYYYYNY